MPSVKHIASAALPTRWGRFVLHGFEEAGTGREHLALACGELADGGPPLCRVHSECLTGESLRSLRCDCGPQLELAMRRVADAGRGLILYLRQEGRDIGLLNKIRAYALQDAGADTVEANARLGFEPDSRDYGAAGSMLAHFGVRAVRLMSDNPRKAEALERMGVRVAEVLPHRAGANPHNERYLKAKIGKLGHAG